MARRKTQPPIPTEDTGPVPVPGITTGPRAHVDQDEQEARRLRLRQLLISETPRPERNQLMFQEFGMSARAVSTLQREILEEMNQELSEMEPYQEALLSERLGDAITQAKLDRSWSAVSRMLELKAKIVGAEKPRRVQVDIGAQLPASILAMLGTTSEKRLFELAEAQAKKRGELPPMLVPTTGEPVE